MSRFIGKRLLLTVLALPAVAIVVLFALRSNPSVEAVPLAGPAKLTIAPNELKLGTLLPGTSVTGEFAMRNAGGSLLEIRNLKTSCGCAPAEIDRDSLLPGEAATIKIRLRAPTHAGQIVHALFFNTNDPNQPSVAMAITGRSQWPVEASPSVLQIPAVAVGQTVERELEVYSSDAAKPLALKRMQSSVRWIEVKLAETAPHRTRIAVRLTPPERGSFRQSIMLETDSQDRPNIIVPVEGDALGGIRVSPQACLLGLMEASAARRLAFVAHGTNTTPRIRRVEMSDKGWSINNWKAEPHENRLILSVFVRLPIDLGHARATIRIYFEQNSEVVDIPISANVKK